MLIYALISICEFLLHKFVMHCDENSLLSKIINTIPILNRRYNITCSSHKTHHLEVAPDMTLSENKSKESLFMGWKTYPFLFIFMSISCVLSKWISGYSISYTALFMVNLILPFIWSYIWNKVHFKMHDYEVEYSIKEGPYDENIFTMDPIKKVLVGNHTKHHLQKGEKKGNYNVIVLGADEWFGYNVKEIDNKEYCNSHQNEKICNS